MKLKQVLLFFGILLLAISGFAQTQEQSVQDYINKYKDIAIEEMVRCHIPASITLAQGIHESSCGKSPLSCQANNHFGIKCKEEWDGKKYYQNDDAPNECFRVYEHAEASYADHSDFLVTRPRYANLFQLKITDYKGWATGLKADGYATNPKYAQILIKTIIDNNLTQYDEIGIAMIAQKEKLMNNDKPAEPVLAKVEKSINKKQHEAHNAKVVVTEPAQALVENTENKRQEYIVNGMRALKAEGNEDPLKIAFDYTLDYQHVLAFNDLGSGDKFKDGQYIFLQAKRNKGSEKEYVVKPGESMHDIAQKFGIKLRELYVKNLMKPNDQPLAGETISLQDRRTTEPRTMVYADYLKSLSSAYALTKAPPEGKSNTATTPAVQPTAAQPSAKSQYEVQQTDTLYSIARKFNMSVDDLKQINNLDSTDIKIGQTLLVSK